MENSSPQKPQVDTSSAPPPVRDPRTARILAAYFGVYRTLGWGFLESVYVKALAVELSDQGAKVTAEVPIHVHYKARVVGEYRADLIVDGAVIVEVKAADALTPSHRAQLLNYLKATDIELGMLLNFGPRPAYERLIFSNSKKTPRPLRF